jgi:hypothetical protein
MGRAGSWGRNAWLLATVAGVAAFPALATGSGSIAPRGWTIGEWVTGDGRADTVNVAAVTPAGAGEVFADRSPEFFDPPGTPYRALSMRHESGTGSWSPPRALDPGSDLVGVATNRAGSLLAASRVVRAGTGEVEVAVRVDGAWTRRATLRPPPGTAVPGRYDRVAVSGGISDVGAAVVAWPAGPVLLVATLGSSGWTRPTALPLGSLRAAYPVVAVNRRGDALVAAWGRPLGGGASRILVTAYSARSRTWRKRAPLRWSGGVARRPLSIALRASGQAAITWDAAKRVWLADGDAIAGRWRTPVIVSGARSAYAEDPHAALAPDGRTLVVWLNARGDHQVIARTRTRDGRWLPRIVSRDPIFLDRLSLVMDASGRAMVAASGLYQPPMGELTGAVVVRALAPDRLGVRHERGYRVTRRIVLRRTDSREVGGVQAALSGVHTALGWVVTSGSNAPNWVEVAAGPL